MTDRSLRSCTPDRFTTMAWVRFGAGKSQRLTGYGLGRGGFPVLFLVGLLFWFPEAVAAGIKAPPVFVKLCTPCHGKDGNTPTPAGRKLGVKKLGESSLSDAEIRKQLMEGRKGPDGAVRMPSFSETLKPGELEALVRFVRGLQKTAGGTR